MYKSNYLLIKIMSSYKFQYFLLIILFSSVFCLIGCQQDTSSQDEIKIKVGMVGYGYLADPKKQQALLDELDQEDIYYELHELRNKERLYHRAEDTARFYNIERKILYGEELNPDIQEVIFVSGKEQKDEYVDAFEKADVPFWTRDVSDEYPAWAINYSQYYGPKVDQIRQEMELRILQSKRDSMREYEKNIRE